MNWVPRSRSPTVVFRIKVATRDDWCVRGTWSVAVANAITLGFINTPAIRTPRAELEVFNWDFMSNASEDHRKHQGPIFIVNEKETITQT